MKSQNEKLSTKKLGLEGNYVEMEVNSEWQWLVDSSSETVDQES